jgi:hypothetical protein
MVASAGSCFTDQPDSAASPQASHWALPGPRSIFQDAEIYEKTTRKASLISPALPGLKCRGFTAQFGKLFLIKAYRPVCCNLNFWRGKMAKYQIAQVNIGRIKAQLDDPRMAGFVARLDEINALADNSRGFVWRLQTPESNNNTYLRPYEDDRMLLNMSVWESVEALKEYVYRTAHAELLRQRHEWFEKISAYAALWWVPAGHLPGVDEAKKRLAYLEVHGPTQFAFTFKLICPPDEQFQQNIDWSSFRPCPAT